MKRKILLPLSFTILPILLTLFGCISNNEKSDIYYRISGKYSSSIFESSSLSYSLLNANEIVMFKFDVDDSKPKSFGTFEDGNDARNYANAITFKDNIFTQYYFDCKTYNPPVLVLGNKSCSGKKKNSELLLDDYSFVKAAFIQIYSIHIDKDLIIIRSGNGTRTADVVYCKEAYAKKNKYTIINI